MANRPNDRFNMLCDRIVRLERSRLMAEHAAQACWNRMTTAERQASNPSIDPETEYLNEFFGDIRS